MDLCNPINPCLCGLDNTTVQRLCDKSHVRIFVTNAVSAFYSGRVIVVQV